MNILSIYVDGGEVKVALLSNDKKKIEFVCLQALPLNVKPLDISAGRPVKTISALSGSQVFIRELPLKLKTKRAILSALPFQVEPILPYPLAEAILLPIIKKEKEGAHITLFASKQETLLSHLAEMAKFEVDPEIVSSSAQAVFRMGQHSFPNKPLICSFYFGKQESLYTLAVDGKLSFSQPFKYTLRHFFDALEKDHPDSTPPDLRTLDPKRFPHLTQLKNQFQKELERALAFLNQKHAVQEIALLGEINSDFHLGDWMGETFGTSLSILNVSDSEYSIPIGLALDALSHDGASVQFRQGNFSHQGDAQKRLKRLFTYAGSAMALSALMWGSGTLLLSHKERNILTQIEKEIPLQKEGTLSEKLDHLERHLSAPKKSFPYHPTVPKLSDVLAWLSTHPDLNPKEKGERIEIKNIHYSLVKYPKLGTAPEPYQARVELELTATSPRLARNFHDALIKGDRMVNSKTEITWNVDKNLYRTSFFLNATKEK